MAEGAFSEKLVLVLKALSLSRAQLAADLGVDKSVVTRWASGAVRPSDHNLARLTALVATRAPGFTALDWDRSLPALAERLGAEPGARPAEPAIPLPLLEQVRGMTAFRGAAYEGIYRSTRPFLLQPGGFLHDHGMIRLDEHGLLSLYMITGATHVRGWMLPLQNQLYCVAADVVSGAYVFGIFNGVAQAKAQVIDGLILGSALDPGRTPTANVMMFERVADLTGERAADEARLAELAGVHPVAAEGSVPEALRRHLNPDVGPTAFAAGGDLLLRMPLSRSLSRGPDYDPEGG